MTSHRKNEAPVELLNLIQTAYGKNSQQAKRKLSWKRKLDKLWKKVVDLEKRRKSPSERKYHPRNLIYRLFARAHLPNYTSPLPFIRNQIELASFRILFLFHENWKIHVSLETGMILIYSSGFIFLFQF